MHIVFLSHEYPLWSPGGVGTFIQTLGRALVENGHKVKVLGPGKELKEVQLFDEGVELIRLPKTKGVLPAFIHNALVINRKLKSIHSKDPIDIIESAELGLAFIRKNHKAKKIIRLHGGHHFFAEAEKRGINWKKGWMEKRSFKKADAFIAVSNYVKEHTQKFLSYHNKPLEVINLPINTHVQMEHDSVDEKRLLYAGTVCEKKGARQLLEAFRLVKQQFPSMQLDYFGRDWFFPNGDSYIENLKQVYDVSYFEDVTFHGNIPREELMKKYGQAAVCVFPSHMETQGLVCLEAMLMARPVVFTKYGPGQETIDHAVTGLLCDVYNPKDIASKIIELLTHKDFAIKLGQNAREIVKEKYDAKRILGKNLHFYKSVIKL